MTEHAVVIAGGGPTGMMLAAELVLAKVDVAVVERRAKSHAPRLTGQRLSLANDRGAGSTWGR
jgi:2-polyprenyl-6-methoxyphenol hydroxylase-like FAD-dependent oxidoreductase